MSTQEQEWGFYEPCTDCGSDRFVQTVKQDELVQAERDEIHSIEAMDHVDTIRVECWDCGEVLFDEEEEDA